MNDQIMKPEKGEAKLKRKKTGGSGALRAVHLPVLLRRLCLLCLFCPVSVFFFIRFISAPGGGHLTRITFPASFAEFTGYTPAQEEALWREAEDSKKRYTRLERGADNSVSIYVTPAQLRYNRRIYEEGLSGWKIRCEAMGIRVIPSGDYRTVSLTVRSYDDYVSAAGELKAALTAVSCLQFLRNGPDDGWHLTVRICPASAPARAIASYVLPGKDPHLAENMWP